MSEFKFNEPSTPKLSTQSRIQTSTVNKKKGVKPSPHDSCLSILSLQNVNLSNIVSDISSDNIKVEEALNIQRQLANETLERVSKIEVGAIPSRLLKPNLTEESNRTNSYRTNQSTVNESDLMDTPKNTSTPRNSSVDQLSIPRESIFTKFKEMLDTDISTQNFVEEFKQISQANRTGNQIDLSQTNQFLPAEEAAAKLMADEMSWRRKNDIPQGQAFSTFNQTRDSISSVSIGEFFKKKTADISDLKLNDSFGKIISPAVPVDVSVVSNQTQRSDYTNQCDSLTVSAIQQLLAESSQNPSKIIEKLFNKGKSQSRENNYHEQRESSAAISLPVSQNVSYTSSFSDNEAIREAVVHENKENIEPENIKVPEFLALCPSPLDNACGTISRSSSSLTSLPNGKLPIESTVNELVWGCVKVDRCVTKQFLVRNKSTKTLRLQCTISTHDFKIRKDNRLDSDYLTACKFVLRAQESRPLILSFVPSKVGPAIDELCFTPLDTHLKQTKKQCVYLWGYGGFISIEYQNVSRDNTGKYWLSLGRLDNRVQMEQLFVIKNIGNLPSFTYIKILPKHMVAFTTLKVEPDLFVLLPNEEKKIKVSYVPTSKDYSILRQNLHVNSVLDIGKLKLVSGAEVNRARLRRLYRKRVAKSLDVDSLTKILADKIKGEVFTNDTTKFKESPNSLNEILETFCTEEMEITVEHDANQTLVTECPEDSIVYQSLCQQTLTALDDTVITKSCRLEPYSIVLIPPSKTKDRLYLISESMKTLHFEVASNPTGLEITPSMGAIPPGETVNFKISLLPTYQEKLFKVFVYVENDVFESEVKVLTVRSSVHKHFLD
ncbi:hypothetical protein ABEB36_007388 [Hypothenemus hampei]|uniref:MSP domain-containing protein n=1 Tax=Hypothenemus hampei TaxID=57062 RepID=A0ABD1EW55_HYPHA